MDFSSVALLGVRVKARGARARAGPGVAAVVHAARSTRASTSTLVHAVVAQPAVVGVHSHVAVVLSVPVARLVANTRASIPVTNLLEAVVSVPALVVVVVARVAPDLSLVTFRDPGVEIAASRARARAKGLTVCRKLTFKWDPRSWAPGKGSRGKDEKGKHL